VQPNRIKKSLIILWSDCRKVRDKRSRSLNSRGQHLCFSWY